MLYIELELGSSYMLMRYNPFAPHVLKYWEVKQDKDPFRECDLTRASLTRFL